MKAARKLDDGRSHTIPRRKEMRTELFPLSASAARSTHDEPTTDSDQPTATSIASGVTMTSHHCDHLDSSRTGICDNSGDERM